MKKLKKILSLFMMIIIMLSFFSSIGRYNALAETIERFETEKGYFEYYVNSDNEIHIHKDL